MASPPELTPELLTLFINTMQDLKYCISSHDEYILQKAAPLIRSLIIDQPSLVHSINAHIRLKIRYTVNAQIPVRQNENERVPFDGVIVTGSLKPIPDLPPASKSRLIAYDEFLKLIPVVANRTPITVQDIFDHYAYVYGTIHPYPPKTPLQEGLLALRSQISVGPFGGSLVSFRALAEIVHEALAPLEVEVINRYTIPHAHISTNLNDQTE